MPELKTEKILVYFQYAFERRTKACCCIIPLNKASVLNLPEFLENKFFVPWSRHGSV